MLRLCVVLALAVAVEARLAGKAAHDAQLNAFVERMARTAGPEEALSIGEGQSTCAKHNLCSKCLTDPDCVWCADGKGSCVPGNAKGPVESTQCKAWEASYCRAEPCGVYTSCATCVGDPFCGWAGGVGGAKDNVCVEGHKDGPLTGKVLGEWFYLAKSCPARALPEGVTKEMVATNPTGGAGVDAQAGAALKQVEGAANKMAKEMDTVRQDEGKMLSKQKNAFDIMKHLRIVLDEWKKRSAAIEAEKDRDRMMYLASWNELRQKREHALQWLRTGIEDMYKTELAEQELLNQKKQQEGAFEEGEQKADDAVSKAGEEGKKPAMDHLTSLTEDHSMKQLENWLTNMNSEDRMIMKKLARSAGNEIEKELHYAAARRMAREEAGWYACAYILADPEQNLCNDFHEKYSGTEKVRDITEEEHTRVCNLVKSQLDRTVTLPTFKGNPGGRKNIQLAWCVNNIKLD